MNSFLLYLVEVTLYSCVFAIYYRFIFQNLTHFVWNRWYLMFGLILSILAPFLTDFMELGKNETSELVAVQLLKWKFEFLKSPSQTKEIVLMPSEVFWQKMDFSWISYLLSAIYLCGFMARLWQLMADLIKVKKLIRNSKIVEITKDYILHEQDNLPAFSFWNHIFLNKNTYSLPVRELGQIILHENIHVKQKHTADILIFEIAGVVFWFNPAIRFMANSVRLTHEYIVDSIVAETHSDVISYSKLLLKLSTAKVSVNFAHSFSNKQVFFRISMLTKSRSVPMQKLKFLSVLPVIAVVMTLCAFVKNDKKENRNKISVVAHKSGMAGIPIGKINWTGNTIYTDEQLNKITGIKPGDFFDAKTFDNTVNGMKKTTLTSLYMDQGYLFFRTEVVEKKISDKVDLEISIDEGNKVKVGKIIIKGKGDVSTQEVLDKIAISSGELFSRTKLIKAQQSIAEMGMFNPGNVTINPLPDEKSRVGNDGHVDLEFILERK